MPFYSIYGPCFKWKTKVYKDCDLAKVHQVSIRNYNGLLTPRLALFYNSIYKQLGSPLEGFHLPPSSLPSETINHFNYILFHSVPFWHQVLLRKKYMIHPYPMYTALITNAIFSSILKYLLNCKNLSKLFSKMCSPVIKFLNLIFEAGKIKLTVATCWI